MHIITEGSISFVGGGVVLTGWEVQGGTQQDLINYAMSRVPVHQILLHRLLS